MASVGRIQFQDRTSVFCVFGYFNRNHSEWLGSLRTGVHCVATCDFVSLSGCTQLIRGSTHRAGGILDLVMSNVPDLCKVLVGCPIGRSDQSHVGIGLVLLLGSPGCNFSHGVMLNS